MVMGRESSHRPRLMRCGSVAGAIALAVGCMPGTAVAIAGLPASGTTPGSSPSTVGAGGTPIASMTTPTSETVRNSDGTLTTQVTARPVRAKGADGVWRPIDTSLVPQSDGSFKMANSVFAQTVSSSGSGPIARVQTSAGTIVFSHPGAQSAAPQVTGSAAAFPSALSGGRDISISMHVDGFEEDVTLPNASAPKSYSDSILLPAGLVASPSSNGDAVNFIDAAGNIIGTFGGGVAYSEGADSAIGPEMVNVTSRITSTAGSVITVTNSIADATWLTAPGRTFPVIIDPTYTATTASGQDTYVNSDNCTGVYYAQSNNLRVGSAHAGTEVNCGNYSGGGSYDPGYARARTFLYFPLTGITPGNTQEVTSANLTVKVMQSCANRVAGCVPSGNIYAGGLATWWNQVNVDWQNQPAPDPYPYAYYKPVLSAGGTVSFNVTSLAQRWLSGSEANNGVELIASGNEHSLNVFQNYYPSEAVGQSVPTLTITYATQCTETTKFVQDVQYPSVFGNRGSAYAYNHTPMCGGGNAESFFVRTSLDYSGWVETGMRQNSNDSAGTTHAWAEWRYYPSGQSSLKFYDSTVGALSTGNWYSFMLQNGSGNTWKLYFATGSNPNTASWTLLDTTGDMGSFSAPAESEESRYGTGDATTYVTNLQDERTFGGPWSTWGDLECDSSQDSITDWASEKLSNGSWETLNSSRGEPWAC